MKEKIKKYWQQACSDWNYLFKLELKHIVKDEGVLIFFFLVPLAYPLLYSFIYTNEVVREVPIAVVDESHTAVSRKYLRHVDASPDVKIIDYCTDMAEAKRHVEHREAYGIVRIPADFSKRLSKGEQVEVNVYSDMSGMLYYKSILTTNTNVSLAMNAHIKVARSGNTTEQQDLVTQHPIAYEEVSLYNPQNGFASFLIPAVLILIIQQTLLLGVGISAGTAREQNRFRELTPFDRHHTGLLRIVLSKSSAYMLVYIPISVYILGVVPRLFHLNQIGNPVDMALFIVPFLLACTFFAMTVSGVIRQRETCIMIIVFTSLPLLFISGVSWPGAAVPKFWKGISYLFPSTLGINGFLKINNMGAHLPSVSHEWYILWTQAACYFVTSCLIYRRSIITSRRRFVLLYNEMKQKMLEKKAHRDNQQRNNGNTR